MALLGLTFGVTARAQQPADPNQANPPQDSAQYDQTPTVPPTDPPSRVARLSVAQGTVSVEPASVDQFSPAEVNAPLTTGDRVWTGGGSVAELQAGLMAARMGATTDLTVTAMTDTLAQFGLGQGSLHLVTYALDPEATTELDTPNVALSVLAAGDVRVSVDPVGQFTDVRVLSGVVQVDGNGLQQTLGAGQAARFSGLNGISMQWLQTRSADALDDFSKQRDQAYQSGESAEQAYLNMDTVGAADLYQYGIWIPQEDYGNVWFPAGVPEGWQPYCYGRWTWVAPWGWTWIESEAWGFAPFHYGRWAIFGGRWGWVPGPPVVHPVYAPALVVFVHPGNGVSAWFPLGPKEPYAPWYHSSTLYQNRVNASDLYSRNLDQVRTMYNTSNREAFANPLGGERNFDNRAAGTVEVPQDSLASGKPVRGAMLHLPEQQIAAAPVLPHPMISPERTMVVPAAARALPPRLNRPTLMTHGQVATGNGQEQQRGAPPERGQQTAGTKPQGQPAPVERRGFQVQGGQPLPDTTQANPQASQQQSGMNIQGAVRPPNPARGTQRLPPPTVAPPPRGQVPAGSEQLYNRAVPPPTRPSFEQQRQAIQSTDPGRPLSPQQMDNLRENRPVGQPETREAAPHPAVAPPPQQHPQPQRSGSPEQPRQDNRKH